MIYIYDGSFYGLLTTIFNAYKVLENVDDILEKSNQIDFFTNKIESKTEKEKAERVKKSIVERFSYSFYKDIIKVFSSSSKDKEIAIAKTLKKLYIKGFSYIGSADSDVILFKNLLKNVSREIHSYKGLLRFNEHKGILFAKFTPENDILNYLYYHFKSRLKNEKFIIADTKRHKAVIYNGKKGEFFKFEESKSIDIDDEYVDLWIEFYNSISIKERKNEKLRVSNMPKKYWKDLPEIK